ncbi:hypothetical protein CRUP_015676, partial [Coryphaenoides rupestris]
GSLPGGHGHVLAPRGVQLLPLPRLPGGGRLRGGARSGVLRELLRAVPGAHLRSLPAQDPGGGDERPEADVARSLLRLRVLPAANQRQHLPHGGRTALLFLRFVWDQLPWLRLPHRGRGQVPGGSELHVARQLLR